MGQKLLHHVDIMIQRLLICQQTFPLHRLLAAFIATGLTRPWGVQEGMFGLREWEDEGFMPQAQEADDPTYDPTSIKKPRQPSARVCTCLHNLLASVLPSNQLAAIAKLACRVLLVLSRKAYKTKLWAV